MNAVVAVNEIPAGELLGRLRGIGLRVWLNEEGVVRVSPRDRLTPELRSQIQGLRDGLVVHLESERRDVERLVGRVQSMGKRWGYSLEELEEAQLDAQRDPQGWGVLCQVDELSARRARQAGISFP